MVQQIGLFGTDIWVVESLVYLHWLSLYILAIFIIQPFLGNLAYVYFGVEVGCKSFVVVAGVAVNDVEVLYLLEVVLGSVGGEDGSHSRVEAASEYGAQSSLLEAFSVGPLP